MYAFDDAGCQDWQQLNMQVCILISQAQMSRVRFMFKSFLAVCDGRLDLAENQYRLVIFLL